VTPFYGWVVAGGAFVVLFFAYGAQYSFGVFFAALLDEFHWSRASLSGVFSLYAFLYCVLGFPAGRLTDRWGPRAVITCGAVFLGGALALMSRVTSLWQPYLVYGILAAIGMGTAYVPCHSTVVKWFLRRRGLAVGLASTGASAGMIALPPVAQALAGSVGWRWAYLAFGIAVFVILAGVARVMRRDPESMGLHPDGDPAPPPAGALAGDGDWPLGRALRTRAFWLIGAAFAATWLPVFVPLVHLVPFTRDLGHTTAMGAWVVSVTGLGALLGRLAMGVVSDRFGRQRTIAGMMVVQAVAFVGLAAARGLPLTFLSGFLFGFSYGPVSTLFAAIIGDFFGRAQTGSLVGFLFALSGSMGGLGPVTAGAVYDAVGSYRPTFLGAAALNVAAAGLLLACRPPVLQSSPVRPREAR